MGLSYTHLLVSNPPTYSPSIDRVSRFLAEVLDQGFIGGEPKIALAQLEAYRPDPGMPGKVPGLFPGLAPPASRTYWRAKARTSVKDCADIPEKGKEFANLNVSVSGHGIPKREAVKVYAFVNKKWQRWDQPYTVEVVCCIRSVTVSTSDYHEGEAQAKREAIPFGAECDARDNLGLFTHPTTLEVIEVPGAGCARFWIEVRYGKFLFPKVRNGDLSIVHPRFLRLAAECFDAEFAQGCNWG